MEIKATNQKLAGDAVARLELNGKIINKNIFKKKILNNNDILEIVHFIGGG